MILCHQMTMKRFIITIDLLLLCCSVTLFPGYGQEVLLPAGMPYPAAEKESPMKSAAAGSQPDTTGIPFFDDFSRVETLPDPQYWTDDDAYVNNSYAIDPVTIGVATLDAIASDGTLNGSGDLPFVSDYLTSVPINLEYPGREDIWLSFFYEPQGLSDDPPDTGDSLTVDFWAPDSSRWETVWAHEGPGTDSLLHARDTFLQVYIPVTGDRFLKKGFRFRFKNYASLPVDPYSPDKKGNVDPWHIDYVYLDTGRSASVTAIHDVSMISPIPSMLKSFEAIPWTHFPQARLQEIKSGVDITYRNNDTTTRNITRILKITDLNNQVSDSVNGGTANVEPGILKKFSIPFVYPFKDYDADTTIFRVMSYLITEEQDYKWNDTAVRYQVFSNYYAYDDGSAENGYGLRGEGTSRGMVAMRFRTFKNDTLRAVQMYFNRTFGDASRDYFRLAVWDHDETGNRPGNLLYSQEGARPEYADKLNAFTTYPLDTLLVVSDVFYVGWIKTTENSLNVGFDRNIDRHEKLYYNIGQDWMNSGFAGSLMLRPVMGRPLPASVEPEEAEELRVSIYPNPAATYFRLDWPPPENAGEWSVALLDLQGRTLYRARGSETFHDVSRLPEGFYILKLERSGRKTITRKIMIIR